MKWHIGQQIVAIRTHSQGKFKRGQDFPIKGLRGSQCKCNEVEIDIGIKDDYVEWCCPTCNMEGERDSYIVWFSEHNFAPLDQDISELTEILEHAI